MTAKSLPELVAECGAVEKIHAAVCARIAALAHTQDQTLLCCVLCLMCCMESGDVCIRLEPESFKRMTARLREKLKEEWTPGMARTGDDAPVPTAEAAVEAASEDSAAAAGKSEPSLIQVLDRFERQLTREKFPALCQKLESFRTVLGTEEAQNTPLVISRGRLYLRRYWQYEAAAARYLAAVCRAPAPWQTPKAQLKQALKLLFPAQSGAAVTGMGEPDYQKVAAAMAASGCFTVISGGPGTGKTTTVAKLLLLLLSVNPKRSRILLAAPTGKAAARIGESIAQVLKHLDIKVIKKLADLGQYQDPGQLLQLVPSKAVTVHRLLKTRPHRTATGVNAGNLLACDVLVIDEVSMLDLPLFAKVCAALPGQCQVILLGDKDQLCSVEAGSVLSDLCRSLSFEKGDALSPGKLADLKNLTAYSATRLGMDGNLSDYVTVLSKNFRFKGAPGIGKAASWVNAFKVPAEQRLEELKKLKDSFCLKLYEGEPGARALQNEVETHILEKNAWGEFWDFLKKQDFKMDPQNAKMAFEYMDKFRILCSNRQGGLGTKALNRRIERVLRAKSPDGSRASPWFSGQLFMVTANNPAVGISNGNVGFYCRNRNGEMRAWLRADAGTGSTGTGEASVGEIKDISPVLLTSRESAYAITVHKSQGSEYDRVVFYLAGRDNEILTKELIYTGITRAKKRLELYADEKILVAALGRRVIRESGLQERLEALETATNAPAPGETGSEAEQQNSRIGEQENRRINRTAGSNS